MLFPFPFISLYTVLFTCASVSILQTWTRVILSRARLSYKRQLIATLYFLASIRSRVNVYYRVACTAAVKCVSTFSKRTFRSLLTTLTVFRGFPCASGEPTKSSDGFLMREKSTFFQRSIREANWRPGVGRLVTWSTVNDRGRELRMRQYAGDPDARNVIAARPFSPILGDPRGLSRSPRG